MSYEVLPPMLDACHEVLLLATFTPNNGIRVGLLEHDTDWREFDFSQDQAKTLGEALIRWSIAGHDGATWPYENEVDNPIKLLDAMVKRLEPRDD